MKAREDPSTCASVLKVLLSHPPVLEEIVFSTVTLLDFLRDYRTDAQVILSLCRALRSHCVGRERERGKKTVKVLPFIRVSGALSRVIDSLSMSLDQWKQRRERKGDRDRDDERDGEDVSEESDREGEREQFPREVSETIHCLLEELPVPLSPRFAHIRALSPSHSLSSATPLSPSNSTHSLASTLLDACTTVSGVPYVIDLRQTINRENERLNKPDSGRGGTNIRTLLEEMRALKREYQKKYKTQRSRPFLAFLRRK